MAINESKDIGIGDRLPAFPHDDNRFRTPPLVGAIVDDSGNISGYRTLVVREDGKLLVDANFTGTISVTLDPYDDGVAIFGTPDGGTTQVQVLVSPTGEIVIDLMDELYTLLNITRALSTAPFSVRLSDGVNFIDVATEATLQAVLDALGGAPSATVAKVSVYNEVSAIPAATDTLILSYTVPVGKTLVLRHVEVSGDNIATFRVLVNALVVAKRRTYFTEYNQDFFMSNDLSGGISVPATQVVEVRVLHNRPSLGTFNASLYGVLA